MLHFSLFSVWCCVTIPWGRQQQGSHFHTSICLFRQLRYTKQIAARYVRVIRSLTVWVESGRWAITINWGSNSMQPPKLRAQMNLILTECGQKQTYGLLPPRETWHSWTRWWENQNVHFSSSIVTGQGGTRIKVPTQMKITMFELTKIPRWWATLAVQAHGLWGGLLD